MRKGTDQERTESRPPPPPSVWSEVKTMATKRTSCQVLLSEHLTDGGAVILHLTDPLLSLLIFIVQILLQNTQNCIPFLQKPKCFLTTKPG